MSTTSPPGRSSWWVLTMVPVVLRHPELWWVAIRQARRLVPTAWWRRAPFLPLPDAAYLRFRLVTQYGRADQPPRPEDLLSYLRWCRNER